MSETAELKKAWEDTKTVWENEFKKAALTAADEKKSFGQELGLTKEKLVRMEEVIAKYDLKWEEKRAKEAAMEAKAAALEAAILDLKLPRSPGGKSEMDVRPELRKFFSESKSFDRFLKVGEEKMAEAETKGLATDSSTAGGFLLPTEMSSTMIELNVLYSPIRQIADVMTISSGDSLEIPKEGSTAFTAQWISERAARSETTAGSFAMVRIPTHELEANPWVTQKMLDDSAINVEQYIAKKLGEQFGKAEGVAFCTGSGVGRPEGIETAAGITPTVVTATNVFTAALLLDFQHTLEEPYASRATWVAKRAMYGKIRQLTAATDNFLWQPGLAAGEPPTLLGRPYIAANDVSGTLGTDNDKLVYFGDFKAGYKIVDRMGVRVLRDPYTNKPNVEFTTYKRVGGQVVLPEAIKIGKSD